jgi:saccharopine dehydrogenase-like NADP-dependent oxidoreductase
MRWAAIKIGIDYLDIHHPQRNVPVLMNLAPEIKNAGLCFITQAGFYPGLPSVLTRFASMFFTRYRKSVVEVAMNTQFDKGGSLDEFIDSLGDYSAEVFKGGKWEQGGPRDWVKIDFGSSIGSKICYPMTMVEMKALPGALGLEEAGVYAAGLNWFVDYLVTPAAVALGKVRGIGQRFFGFTNGLGLDDFLR